MRALTLHQPYATAMALGLKRIETRSWSTKYRGPVVIHAATADGPEQRERFYGMHKEDRAAFAAAGYRYFPHLPFMRPVAVGDLVACDPTDQLAPWLTVEELRWGNYAAGRFAWRFENIRPLDYPCHITGYQGLWHWKHGDLTPHLRAA